MTYLTVTFLGKKFNVENSYVIRKERCPDCARLGKDQSGDNLAVYSDGHSYCYSCGYGVRGDVVSRFQNRNSGAATVDVREHRVYLPEDCDVIYPTRAIEWVGQYEITKRDLLNHNTLWSESTQRLVFPVFGDTGLLAYQGRYFGPPSPEGTRPYPKWHGQGNLKETYNVMGQDQNRIILTEDVVSAIKLSKITMAMPLYGCKIGIDRFKGIKARIKAGTEVWWWLDPDKRSESIVETRRGMLCGLTVHTIFSPKDPKEHSFEELKEILAT